MSIEQQPFRKYKLDEESDERRETFTVSINSEERIILNKCKRIIEQPKDSTAIKTLAWIGAKVLHEDKISYILESLFKNKRNNKRMGISEFE